LRRPGHKNGRQEGESLGELVQMKALSIPVRGCRHAGAEESGEVGISLSLRKSFIRNQ
jgi:hypothetical protein